MTQPYKSANEMTDEEWKVARATAMAGKLPHPSKSSASSAPPDDTTAPAESSSVAATPPQRRDVGETGGRNVMNLTEEEWRVERRAIMDGRRSPAMPILF